HRVALQLHQLQGTDFLFGCEAVHSVARQERVHVARRPVEHDRDVVVACLPRVAQQYRRMLLEIRRDLITQPVERGPERLAPRLVPSRVTARAATAIRTPALHSMCTAPRAALHDADLMAGRA